mmetsp:Transcript_15142/g.48293  ORF Transcript_15142/g.48293 Transcript_15142/m.48293 type:complete len:284 (+) Transcript_15142:191-1042(+)
MVSGAPTAWESSCICGWRTMECSWATPACDSPALAAVAKWASPPCPMVNAVTGVPGGSSSAVESEVSVAPAGPSPTEPTAGSARVACPACKAAPPPPPLAAVEEANASRDPSNMGSDAGTPARPGCERTPGPPTMGATACIMPAVATPAPTAPRGADALPETTPEMREAAELGPAGMACGMGGPSSSAYARKSNASVCRMAIWTSSLCSVLRLFFSAKHQARSVSSKMNISHALANRTGASALIMRTSSSLFMIRLMRARGRSLWFLNSFSVVISSRCISSYC